MKPTIERDLLRHGIVIGIAYQLYQSTIAIFPTLNLEAALVNVIITLLLLFLFALIQKNNRFTQVVAFVLHLIALAGFTYFWIHNGGFAGTVPSFLCAYVSLIAITSAGVFRWIGLSLSIALIITYFYFPEIIGMQHYYYPDRISPLQQSIDYVVIAGVIVVFALSVKKKYLYYKGRVTRRHLQLKKMADRLHSQNQELATSEEETRAINENLEAIVDSKKTELEKQNMALAEFAFINAHMLRGPLCRIMGLLNLMEQDPAKFHPDQISAIRHLANEIDGQVKTINSVLN